MQLHIIILTLLVFLLIECNARTYESVWESLDTRSIPLWYDGAKIGIFVHWGVYSVPAYGGGKYTNSEWFWYYWKKEKNPEHVKFMKENYLSTFSYTEFAHNFKAELFDPKAWAELFEKSGAKYVVLTSKHHDGYTLWPSMYSFNWNSKHIGPRKDLVDESRQFKSDMYVLNKMLPEMYEIVKKYLPEILWVDGDWVANNSYFKATEFLGWLYNDSPVKDTVVVNDRWGTGTRCTHGDFFTCTNKFNPGELLPFKWENAISIDKHSWGYRRVADSTDYYTTTELVVIMVETVSCGGNVLINVGPTSDGRIEPIVEERLLELGRWLSINGEAIYNSIPWKYQNDTIGETWYTAGDSAVYAITLTWPSGNEFQLGSSAELLKKR
ncbi:hypothetical protein ILUMI_21954 [Ignelater luminosus]|uniref:alpha-L-fucosidase n=1 Tax=Ignelater luminosus TaxID=2038154 RepID=A0A8K0G387_IGNLU|nr:hypothetical protein ILUMI_21954 [Ignelater luminosus]